MAPVAVPFVGMAAYIGFGVAEYTVLSPATDFRMDQGNFIYLGGEREIGKTGLFITLSLSFMDSGGQTFYSYQNLGGGGYSTPVGTQVDFKSNHYNVGLGFKFKLFPTTWFRPYGEAGGLFGYHEIEYNDSLDVITPGDDNHKTKDGLTGFGYYAEAGIEVDFSDTFGVKPAARFEVTETRPFETLGEQKVKYEVRIFHLSLLMKF